MNIVEVVRLAEVVKMPDGNPFMLWPLTSRQYDGGIVRIGSGFILKNMTENASVEVRSVREGFTVLGWNNIGEFTVILHSQDGKLPSHDRPVATVSVFRASIEPVRFIEVTEKKDG